MKNICYEELIELIQSLSENEEIIVDNNGIRKEVIKDE